MRTLKILSVILPVFFAATSFAQQRRTPALPKPAAVKFKPPKLTCTLGSFKDSMAVSVKEALAVAGLPLKVTDAKNGVYRITSYYVVYRQVVPTEDEQTQKVTLTTGTKYAVFTTTPLSALWQRTLNDALRPGEEILFSDITVKDAQGHALYAPNIKLMIK